MAVEVDSDDAAGPPGQRPTDEGRVDAPGCRVDVDENRLRANVAAGVGRSDVSEGRNEDLTPGLDAESEECEVQGDVPLATAMTLGAPVRSASARSARSMYGPEEEIHELRRASSTLRSSSGPTSTEATGIRPCIGQRPLSSLHVRPTRPESVCLGGGGEVLRVLHVVPTLFDEKEGILGGAERYAWELARNMSERADTTLLSFGLRNREERVGSLRVRVLAKPWRVRGSQFNPFSLRIFPELFRADVVHCHQQHVLVSSVSALVSRLRGRKVFVTELGGGGWDFSSYMSTDRWFHGHLHISEFSKRVFGHADLARARVIFSGVDTDKFSPEPAVARTGGILFVGRLLPHKGVDRVLEALPPDLPMDVVGRPYAPEYLELLRQLAVGKQVTFHHDFDDVRLLDMYRRARCIVLPSLYKDRYGNETTIPELMGQTLLEGMACGLPAICTDVAAMPESVVDGVTGFVVPPGDTAAMRHALVELYSNNGRATAMGMAARRRMVDHFGWHAVVQRCLDAYEERSATAVPIHAN